jgi:integrative and conjugative element protein (TIGR02256 family)
VTPPRGRRLQPQPPPEIHLADQARDTLVAAGRRSQHQECGGILIGYREGQVVFVEDALSVADPTAGHSSYLRRSRPAEEVLARYLEPLAVEGEEFYLGYVGEWHTHPLPVPPSRTDRVAMRMMARRNPHAVAMVVVARHNDTTVSLHGLVSTPQTARHRHIGRHTTSTVHTN